MADLLRFQAARFGRRLARLDCSPPERFSEAIQFAPISPGCVECHYMWIG